MRIFITVSIICLALTGCGDGSLIGNPSITKRSNRSFGGKLVIEPSRHNLGNLIGGPGKTHFVDTRLINTGRKTLRIYDILVSCDCTNATVSKNVLEPGQSTILHTELKIGDTLGPRVSTISIRSTDETGIPKSINFEWVSDNELRTDANNLVFSNIPRGESFNFDIPINSSYLSICKNCQFKILGNTKMIKSDWKMNVDLIFKDHTIRNNKENSVNLGVIHSVLFPQTNDRHYKATIPLELICREEIRARLMIPVRWSYERDIVVAPSSLSLGIQKPGEIVRRDIFVEGSKNRFFKVMSISSSAPNLIFETEFPNASSTSVFLSFSIRSPLKKGPWREVLTITTDLPKSEIIQVPISGIVED